MPRDKRRRQSRSRRLIGGGGGAAPRVTFVGGLANASVAKRGGASSPATGRPFGHPSSHYFSGEELMLTEDSAPELCSAGISEMMIAEQEKNYYCQRCLNHGELNPRKGHKPDCGYLKCPCPECTMVEQRRQLNNLLSKKKVHCTPQTMTRNGKRVRDPHCARCSAHGVLVPLRGHKRTMCQFVTCTCTLCALVENRRMLMAAQIKLRRLQQKTRDGKEKIVKVRRSRKTKETKDLKVTEEEGQADKRQDSSTSPSPSTIDTMSPSLSISPPSSPPPPLLAPVPIYPFPLFQPSPTTVIPQLLTYLQLQAPPPPISPQDPTSTSPLASFLLPEQLGAASLLASIYLKNFVKI